jgi:hypothetical protein
MGRCYGLYRTSTGFPFYGFFRSQPLDFRPLDQAHQLGAALESGSQR